MQDGISASFLFATAQGRITTSISSRGNYQHIKGNVVRFKKKTKTQNSPQRCRRSCGEPPSHSDAPLLHK